jgi:hypothetical protein
MRWRDLQSFEDIVLCDVEMSTSRYTHANIPFKFSKVARDHCNSCTSNIQLSPTLPWLFTEGRHVWPLTQRGCHVASSGDVLSVYRACLATASGFNSCVSLGWPIRTGRSGI